MDMSLVDSLNYVRSTTKLLKDMREQLNGFIDAMPLPEGTEPIQRANVKMWFNHYMDGVCSFESLTNILRYWGFPDLLKPPIHEMEVGDNGELTLYKIE